MKLNAAEKSAVIIGLRMVQSCPTKGKLDNCFDSAGNPITPLTDDDIERLCLRLCDEDDGAVSKDSP